MKSNKFVVILVGLVLLVSLLLFSITYSVRFNEVVIVTTFGEVRDDSSVHLEPGLHFKLPAPIQAVKKLDRRLQLVETRLETEATIDGLQIIVQAFVLWRIDDSSAASILQFDRAFESLEAARDDIETRMRSAMSAIGAYEFDELIGPDSRPAEAEQAIMDRLVGATSSSGQSLGNLGVKIEKVGLSQVLLPAQTTQNVIQRQQSERLLRAEIVRDRGAADAQRIQSDGKADVSAILTHADLVAQEIRGRGDELARGAIAEMSVDPEFATFLLWLDALERTASRYATFFIPVNFAPFHLLNFHDPVMRDGIPVPQESFPGIPPSMEESNDEVGEDEAGAADASNGGGHG